MYFDARGRRFDSEDHVRLATRGNNRFVVSNGEKPAKFGYTDAKGELVIPHQFDQASDFAEGLATVRQGRKWFFIDDAGETAIEIDPDLLGIMEVGTFSEGLCPIRKTTILNKKPTRKYGYLNLQGQLAIPAQFDGAGKFQGGFAVVDSLNAAAYQPGKRRWYPP